MLSESIVPHNNITGTIFDRKMAGKRLWDSLMKGRGGCKKKHEAMEEGNGGLMADTGRVQKGGVAKKEGKGRWMHRKGLRSKQRSKQRSKKWSKKRRVRGGHTKE
jgi:hypothetical protein